MRLKRHDRLRARAPWPDARERLLLTAALVEDERAVEAWREWGAERELDAIEGGAFRLLPLAYGNLRRLGVPADELRLVRGVYRFAWSRNQMLLDQASIPLARLEQAGVPTMVLKGAALALLHYPGLGTRPMEDVDVLVPFAAAARAIEILRADGWTPAEGEPEQARLRHHAAEFLDPDGRKLDLHWHMQWEAVRDESVWAAARPLEVAGVRTCAPDAADLLVHVCVHGSSANPISPIRWIADALLILRGDGGVSWDRVLSQAVGRELTVSTAAALRYLRDAWEAPVPEHVLTRLRRTPASRSERLAHRARTSPRLPGRVLPIVWERYAKLAGDDRPDTGPVGMLPFLQELWGIERRRELPGAALRRVVRHRV